MNVDRVFFDTNILVYCFDIAETDKRRTSQGLVFTECAAGRAVISYQVTQEFANVAIRRLRGKAEIRERLEGMAFLAMSMHVVQSSERLFNRAIALWDRYSLAWYDALIVAAALEGRCDVLYSEDLQDGLEIDGLRIVNPFR